MSTETGDGCSRVGTAGLAPARRRLAMVTVNALFCTGLFTHNGLKHGRPFADSFTSALIPGAAAAAMMYILLRGWDEWKYTQNKSRLLFLTVVRLVPVTVVFVVLMLVRDWLLGVP